MGCCQRKVTARYWHAGHSVIVNINRTSHEELPPARAPLRVFTDGGHRFKQGAGAWLVDQDQFAASSFPSPSAEHSELMAVVLALEAAPDAPVHVHTDASALARVPRELIDRLTRRWSPERHYLLTRLEAQVTARDVHMWFTPSKGPDRVEQMLVVDTLERAARQAAVLLGRQVTLTPQDLTLSTCDRQAALTALAGWARRHLPDVPFSTDIQLGTSRANRLLPR